MIKTLTEIFQRFNHCEEELKAKSTANRFKKLLVNKNLVFFSEYTDHSFTHCEEILQTCIDLIPEHSKEFLTPKDQLFLTVSILAHDAGMHINEDFFLFLIKDENWKVCNSFNKLSWKREWLDYLTEAKRWDSRKLIQIFGEPKPISVPSSDKLDFTLKDRLLIGEFLRRHHGRLAHEICINGFPNFHDNEVDLFDLLNEFTEKEKDLIGLIARSHTMSLRSCFDYLNYEFHLREFNDIHAVYLMVLLRVSDYLQIQVSRASLDESKLRKIKSPFSSNEWKIHQSIQNITFANEDPESIYIDSLPENVAVYIRTKQWIEGLQTELDNSWAILGEVYGRFKRLNKLGLKLRRIKSSFDDLNTLENKLNFVPQKVSFSSSNPDILKLLIDPLYGSNPTYGVREMLQNSIDAVIERDQYLADNPSLKLVDYEKDWDVEISIHKDENNEPYKLVVADNGIGMTPDIIVNYFLNAGASFRKSLAWKKSFQTKEGHSKILRSGRFGIGVLACFLIGDEIEVETRHIKDEIGVKFNSGIDTELIELKNVACEYGTRISILISESNKRSIEWWIDEDVFKDQWDWFTLSYPRVKRCVYPEKKSYSQEFVVPSKNDTDFDNWHWINVEGYERVFWTFETGIPGLICNGIKIEQNMPSLNDHLHSFMAFKVRYPSVLVFDPDGLLPLNLERNKLRDSELPFKSELTKDIVSRFYNKIKELIPSRYSYDCVKLTDYKLFLNQGISHQDIYSKTLRYSAFLFKKRGILLFTRNMIFKTKTSSVSLIPDKYIDFSFKLKDSQAIASIDKLWTTDESERDLTRACLDLSNISSDKYGVLPILPVKGRISIIPIEFYDNHFLNGKKISKKILPNIIEIERNDYYVLIQIGEVILDNSPIVNLFMKLKRDNSEEKICATQLFVSKSQENIDEIELDLLETTWIEKFGNPLVEYKK